MLRTPVEVAIDFDSGPRPSRPLVAPSTFNRQTPTAPTDEPGGEATSYTTKSASALFVARGIVVVRGSPTDEPRACVQCA